MLGQKAIANGQTLPQVIIVDEDKSVEVRTFIENVAYNKLKNTVRFTETTLENGLALLNEDEAIGVIHIPEGTRDSLETLSPAGMILYIKDSEDIRVQLLRGYMSDMINLLNEGQSGAMVYWKEMVKQSIPYETRLDELESISFDYGIAFLTRGDVFSINDVKDPLKGILPIQYYGYGLIWAMLLMSGIMSHLGGFQDKKTGLKNRLLLSGYTKSDYLISRILTGTMFSVGWLAILVGLYKVLLNIDLLSLHLGVLLMALWVIILLNTYIVLTIENLHSKKFVAGAILVFIVMVYTSGLIIPEFYLSPFFKWIGSINLINFGDNIFKGYPLTTWRSMVPLLYSLLSWLLYKQSVHKVVSE